MVPRPAGERPQADRAETRPPTAERLPGGRARHATRPGRALAPATADEMSGLPTPRTSLRARYVSLWFGAKAAASIRPRPICTACGAGRGDVPLTHLRFRCSNCGSDRTDFVVTSRDNPQPW